MSVSSANTPLGRIAIVGSGAVGCYYGARLAQHGQDVHFLMRSDFRHVREHGLKIDSYIGSFDLPQVNCHEDSASIGPCDLLVIALKSTANASLVEILPPLLGEKTVILTLQNGLGNEAFLSSLHQPAQIMGGLCFVGINRISPGVIHHMAQGAITVGEYVGGPQERTRRIAQAFQESLIPCQVEESLMTARWKKLVWNIPFNGLSIAAGGRDTDAILSDPYLRELTRSLMHEVIGAAQALGYAVPWEQADQMIKSTKEIPAYKTSSLIDYLAGREVELDAIWSEPCRQAAAAGERMAQVEMLHALLRHACEGQAKARKSSISDLTKQ